VIGTALAGTSVRRAGHQALLAARVGRYGVAACQRRACDAAGLAPRHPEWDTQEPFASLLKGDLQAVAAAGPCRLLRSEAGWSAVLQVPTLESEEDLVLRLLENQGVLAQPGYFYDFPRESFVVVSLITPPAVLADGIGRLLRHFDCSVVNP